MLILYFVLIILLSAFTFWGSFHLALLGDDWLAFWRYLQHLGPKSSGEWNHLTYFLTPYGAQDIMMGILQKIIGYSSIWYYVASFVLRMLAAFSLYPLVYYLTKSKLSAFFAVSFFSITVIGFDTTNWSSNMTSYITVTLFNLFLYFFLKSRAEKSIKFFTFSSILYYLAYVTTPIRMHGSLPFIFLLELFWVIQEKKIKIIKKAGMRLGIILMIFFLIRFTGHSQGPMEEVSQRFNLGLSAMVTMLQQGRFDFIFYPVIMFGSMIIPDFIVASFDSSNHFFLLLTGLSFLAITIFLTVKLLQKKNISTSLFIGLSWSLLSFFFAWWWVPDTIFPTTYRYFIVSATGISILISAIIAMGKNKSQQRFLFTFFSFLIILHIISTRIYINYLNNSHGQEISNKIWDSIPKVEAIGKSKEPIIFYFQGDGTNEAILHDVITFGFPPHIGLLYNIREEDGGLPIPMTNWQEVISAVTDGKPLPAYGYKIKSVPIEMVYAFYLQGQENLINVTQQAREKLSQINKENK